MADHKKTLTATDPTFATAVAGVNTQLAALITAIANPTLLQCTNVALSGFYDAAGPSYHFTVNVAVGYQG